jgi:hypothetical protein
LLGALRTELFADAFELDEIAKLGDHHAVSHLRPAIKNWFVTRLGLSYIVVPDLTIRTFPIPTEIAIGNSFQREVLKAPQKLVFFGDLHLFAQDLDRN